MQNLFTRSMSTARRQVVFAKSLIIFIFLILLSINAQAKLVFITNDPAFQNATIVPLDAAKGFAAGVQNVQFTEGGVDFDFTTANINGLSDFRGTLISYFPEGVTVTFSQPMSAIGFQFAFAECQGRARFMGSAATEEHTFEFGQGGIFVGAAEIGDITSVELNGTCFFANWPEMRFDATTPPPPPTERADLSFDKSAPNVASQLDGSIDFDLTVTNNGPDDATGVQLVDFPPGGMQVNNSTPSIPLVSAGGKVVVMGVGDLANSDQYTNTLNMSVPPFTGTGVVTQHPGVFNCNTQLLNVALATGSSIDPNTTNNSDLTVTRFDKASRASVPEICDNGIDDNCNGRVDCGDNACSNSANCRPPRLLNANNNPPSICNTINGIIICLNNGGPAPFPVGPNPAPAPPPPQACTFRDVHGRPFEAPACCCSYGPCDRARCERLAARDPNFKSANPPVNINGYGITQAGRLHEYTITYENIGNAEAIDVRIYDVLAPELDDTTLQINDDGVYDGTIRTITWSDALLPPQEPRTVSFSINARSDLQPGDRIRNQATIIFPNAEQPRTDTNWVEHAIENPDFPAAADLGVVECLQIDPNTDLYTVVLFNKGTAFAHNASAQVINPPPGIVFTDDSARFGRSDDTDPNVIGTVVPLGSTHSIDSVAFTADTPASVCKALNWRISYTSSEGDIIVADVQAAPDADSDGVADIDDNCVNTPNLDQRDTDQDGQGDACETVEPAPCGDLDADNDVDRDDKNLFVAALRSVAGEDRYSTEADFDDDGDVDFSDYQQWYQCYRSFVAQ